MTGLRTWILLLAATSFLGGLAGGRWMTLREAVAGGERGAFEDYALLLEQRFELGPERAGYLRVILESYERDLARLEEQRLAEYWSAVEPELRALAREYEGYIRDRVLPPERRAEYDAAGGTLSGALVPVAPTSPPSIPK